MRRLNQSFPLETRSRTCGDGVGPRDPWDPSTDTPTGLIIRPHISNANTVIHLPRQGCSFACPHRTEISMAMATVSFGQSSNAAADPVSLILKPSESTPTYSFNFSDFLKREYRFGIDPSRPNCKAFREGHCPLGSACPDRHQVTHSFNNLVCKHWLRGLCKKGDQCEFLHEYNL